MSPSVEEIAQLLRIPKKEVKFVRSLVDRWAHSADAVSRFGAPVDKANGNRKKAITEKHAPENGHR